MLLAGKLDFEFLIFHFVTWINATTVTIVSFSDKYFIFSFSFLFLIRLFRQYLAFFAVNSMALSLFRFIGSIGRTEVVANTLGTFTLLLVFVLGGFVIAKGKWLIAFYNYFILVVTASCP